MFINDNYLSKRLSEITNFKSPDFSPVKSIRSDKENSKDNSSGHTN